MTLLLEEGHDLPLCDVRLVVGTGAAWDPPGLEGLARHAVELCKRGAGGKTRAELDAALDELGASLDLELSQDSVTLGGHCLARHLPALVRLLADVLQRPALDLEEAQKLQRETRAFLDEIRDEDSWLVSRFFDRHALPDHPYGKSSIGTDASVDRLTRDAARGWLGEHLTRRNVIFGLAGDVDPRIAEELSAMVLGDLREGVTPSRPTLAAPAFADGRRTVLVDKPERTQSQILLGHPAPRHADPDWLSLHVAATAFGGTFTSRLMTEVRVKRGWSYGASARLTRARGGHTFRIRVFPAAEQTADTLALVLTLWEDLARRGLEPAEIEFAKRYLEGRWAFEIDTPEKRLDGLIDTLVLDLPSDYYARYRENLRAVTPAEVNDAIRRWLRPDAAVITLVATADEMVPRLKGLPLGDLLVVPFDSY